MAASCEKILYQSVLDLDKKQANVTLTPKYIAVEHFVKQKQGDKGLLDVKQTTAHCQVIPLEEVIAVQPRTNPTKDRFKIHNGGAVYQSVELQPVHPSSFDVYIVKRAPKHRWRHRILTFTCKESSVCSQWIENIRNELHIAGSARPKRLLVFINPYGGKKRAPKVFEKVRALFDLAGIAMHVIETQRQYHARDELLKYDLSSIDGVVCVGGDGTFSEVLNGLLDRANLDERVNQSFRHQPARPRLRIGVIPAGSTDSIVCTTVGTNDPVTSALQIIIGASVGVDVNALYKEETFVKYSVTMTSYGYYGDLLADSERFRWMGPNRYNWSGFKKIMLNNSYEGEIGFVPANKNNGHTQDGVVCYSGCVQCQRAGTEARLAYSDAANNASARHPTFDLGSGDTDQGKPGDNWCRVSGKFTAINLVTVSCRCSLSPLGMSPFTHLGDGCMDLILVRDCSRVDYLRHLTRIPSSSADQFDLDFIKVYRVKEFQFRPVEEGEAQGGRSGAGTEGCGSPDSLSQLSRSASSKKSLRSSSSKNSVWNCDGELVTHPCLHIQVHCQLVQLFARGVENPKATEHDTCPVCCNPCTRC